MGRRKQDKRQFWTTDCETDPFRHGRIPVPFLWGLYTGAGYHEFKDIPELIECVKDQDVIVYAHNGGKFDFHYLLNYINLLEKITIINGRLVVAHIGKCEIRDSWNILPVKLADFGGKFEIDYDKLEKEVRHLHMPEIRRYLQQDCVDLWNRVDAFERQFGRHLTLAGAAMHQWESISGLKRPKSDKAFYQNFSPYYYGGRVQCFRRGHLPGPYTVVDLNSAYPDAMLKAHPYGTEYLNLRNPNDFEPTSMVKVSCISNGALPYRNERGNMFFPDDNELRTFHCTGHELIAGLDTGTISRVKVLEARQFTLEVSFEKYMYHFYGDRLTAKQLEDIARALFDKLMMTNLYGKFGANPENYGNFMCVPFYDMEAIITENPEYSFRGMIGDNALLHSDLDEWQSHYINVATAASITGAVRAKLWRAICASDGVAYCDTDSIIAQRPCVDFGDNLGQWKDEGTATDVWIAGKKMYLCDGIYDKQGNPKMATKGVRLKPQQIRDAAIGLEVIAHNSAPTFRIGAKHTVPNYIAGKITEDTEISKFFQTRKIKATG